jgi:rubrerythrin
MKPRRCGWVTIRTRPIREGEHVQDNGARLHWRLEDIPLKDIDLARIRPREEMLFMLAAASFIEFASDTYAGNLADYYSDEPDVASWLSQQWEQEELQHGRALRAYVVAVWPEFPWQAAYDTFFEEYRKLCGVSGYEATRALELAARCVVETGTSTFYRALRDLADEPVLYQLAEHIRSDEVRHYKHFLSYFDRYHQVERNSRLSIFGALKRRLVEARHSDAEIGLWHAFLHVHPGERRDGARFTAVNSKLARMVRTHYPAEQAIKMMMKPLRLSDFASSLIQPFVSPVGRLVRAALLR